MIRDRARAERRSVTDCVHGECPFLAEHGKCLHLVQIDGADVCTANMGECAVHTYDEIANILGITRQAVMDLEKRALSKLKKSMSKKLRREGLSPGDLLSSD